MRPSNSPPADGPKQGYVFTGPALADLIKTNQLFAAVAHCQQLGICGLPHQFVLPALLAMPQLAMPYEGVDVLAGDGHIVRLGKLQAPGRKALDAGPFLSGYALSPGERLG